MNLLIAFILFFIVIVGQGRVPRPEHHRRPGLARAAPRPRPACRTATRSWRSTGVRIKNWNDLRRASSRSAGKEHRRHRPSATASWSTVTATPENVQGGEGILGVYPSTSIRRRRRCSRRCPQTFKSMGTIATRLAGGLGERFSPSGVEKLRQDGASPSAAPEGRLDQPSSTARARSSASSTTGSSSSAATSGSCCPARADQPDPGPVQPHPVAAVRRRPRGGRASTSGSRRRSHRPGAGRLPQADARHRGACSWSFLALGLSSMFLDIRQIFGQ